MRGLALILTLALSVAFSDELFRLKWKKEIKGNSFADGLVVFKSYVIVITNEEDFDEDLIKRGNLYIIDKDGNIITFGKFSRRQKHNSSVRG